MGFGPDAVCRLYVTAVACAWVNSSPPVTDMMCWLLGLIKKMRYITPALDLYLLEEPTYDLGVTVAFVTNLCQSLGVFGDSAGCNNLKVLVIKIVVGLLSLYDFKEYSDHLLLGLDQAVSLVYHLPVMSYLPVIY